MLMTLNMTSGLALVSVQHQNHCLHLIHTLPEVCRVLWYSHLYIMAIGVYIKKQEIVNIFEEQFPLNVGCFGFFFPLKLD